MEHARTLIMIFSRFNFYYPIIKFIHLKQESLYARKVKSFMRLEQFRRTKKARISPRYGCKKLILFQQELTCNQGSKVKFELFRMATLLWNRITPAILARVCDFYTLRKKILRSKEMYLIDSISLYPTIRYAIQLNIF